MSSLDFDEEGPAVEVGVPAVLKDWTDVCKGSLKKNKTTALEVRELDSLVWDSFTQRFTIDPKTLYELTTLKEGSTSTFLRPLTPELCHWHGTEVTFLDLKLLSSLWKDKQVSGTDGV